MVWIVSPKRFRSAIAVALLLSCPAAGSGAAPGGPPDSTRIERIVRLGELWGEIRYRHPWLASKSIDWDSALVAALPKVEAAPDSAAYVRVVGEMIGTIGDPATRLAPSVPADSTSQAMERPFAAWNGDGLVLNLATAGRPDFKLDQELASLADQIPKAKFAVVDARLRAVPNFWRLEPTLSRLLAMLYSGEVRMPGGRYVQYSGYPTQSGVSGFYTLAFENFAEKVLHGTPGIKPGRLVLILDELTPVPAEVLALEQRGLASLVTEGDVNDASVVYTRVLDAGEGVLVEYRLQEFEIPFQATAQVPRRAENAKDLALDKAMGLARAAAPSHRKGPARTMLPSAVWRPDRTYSETSYPDRAHRQLAAIRYWNVIRLFYPYHHLLDGAWDTALARYLPRFEAAKDDREYAMAVLEMSTQVKDGHTSAYGGRIPDVIGRGPGIALDALEIEGKPVVVRVGASATAAGIRVGDIIERVDGEPMNQRMRRLEPFITAATPAALRLRLIRQALNGSDSTTVTLDVRGSAGPKEAKLTRSWEDAREMRTSPDPYKVLPGNVGYVLMERLLVAEVSEMFLKLQDTRAIIFDMRGYPNGTVWPIVPHINTRGAKVGAVFERTLTSRGDPVRLKFEQRLPATDVTLYRGRTLTLIDERAISHAEHSCLFFEAANGTTFVGSPTAGANGDVTRLSLPGGLSVMFTGHDVRHADGRQLQRVGIRPDVPVRPTIAGIRAGRDEVLERALAVLDEKGAAAPRQ